MVNLIEASEKLEAEAVALGQRMRHARIAAGMKLKELARSAGVSMSLVSQVERGLASPSLATLRGIAGALDVPVAAFFYDSALPDQGAPTAGPRRLGGKLLVRHDERKRLSLPKSRVRYELLTPDLVRQLQFMWIEYGPGDSEHGEPSSHPGEESAICVEGQIVVWVDGQEFVLEDGDALSFDSSIPHRVENRSNKRAVVITAITPPNF